ncbi:hypothetical protein SLEP1_g50169 [Rubroshorea leprosula]|uniref:DUF4283 domain-containing protein n=1 Tax=Rubroshorea leprosula TaxID=152421 RepID=A0AAV5M290_9ROSI|nr:hypothetical protein SLEP1_g50169 [Rubroshorea leprosula]
MILSPPNSSEPPPANPILPPPTPPPPPDISVAIPISSGSDLIPTTSPLRSHQELPTKSFRDTLMDGSASIEPPLVTYDEFVAANLDFDSQHPMAEDGVNPSQPKVPKVKIPKSIWQRLCAPWKNAVIIKLLGKSIHFHALHSRLLKDWQTTEEFEVIDVGLGYYIVKFSSLEDCSKILTGGPYKMFDHYLTVQPWEPSFHPARVKAPKTAVWVKLHGVPIVCFYEAICLYLGSKIGKPIKVDPTTLLATRGKFVRVCVEVDLSQRLPSSVDLDLEDLPQSLIPVEYEGLHKICFHCGEFGHTEDICHYKNPEKAPSVVNNPSSKAMIELTQTLKPNFEENNMVFGPWMVQQRRSKRRPPPRRQVAQTTCDSPPSPPKISGSQNPSATKPAQSSPSKIVANIGSHESRKNRFAVIAAISEDDTDLLNSNKDKETQQAGIMPQPQDLVGSSTPMDVASSSPPPPPSTAFVKPKPKKRKAKTGGPVPKDPKPPTPKPYQPPFILKKHQASSAPLPTTDPGCSLAVAPYMANPLATTISQHSSSPLTSDSDQA